MYKNVILITDIYQNTYAGFISLIKGSNLGPPGIAIFKAFAVKKLLVSNR